MPIPNRTLTYLIDAVQKHGNSDQCLPWPFTCDADGYGRCTYQSKTSRVNRVAHILFIGPLAEGQCALHTCDNPPCFNPKHLWAGTSADNDKDRDSKGRASGPKGADSIHSKLSATTVPEMRRLYASGLSTAAIARQFGIAQQTAWKAVTRRTWKHVL